MTLARPQTAPKAPPPPTNATEARRLSVARTHLLLDAPWFGNLAMRLQSAEDFRIKTFDTNGTLLRYNPTFSATLTDRQLIGVLAHEVMHCALLHPFRLKGRNPHQWNEAADLAVNPLLLAQGFELPPGILNRAEFAGMAAEQIYPRLGKPEQDGPPPPEPPPPPPPQPPSQDEQDDQQPGPGAPDPNAPPDAPQQPPDAPGQSGPPVAGNGTPDPSDAPEDGPPCPTGEISAPDADPDPQGPEPMTETDWQVATEQATAISQKAGTAPGNVIEAIDANKAPQIHWKDALARFTEATLPSDYSWSTPNRRHIAADVYLPGTRRENMPRIGFGIDCSGSMTTRLLELIAPEMTALLHSCNPEALDLFLFDTDVREHTSYTPEETGEITLTAKGRGGTAFQPVFDYIAARPELTPACLIMFTDLDGPEPTEPPYPVLWITPESETARAWFGETVRISEY